MELLSSSRLHLNQYAPYTFDTKILDDAAVLHFCKLLVRQPLKTMLLRFFLQFVDQQMENADRVDIILDTYLRSCFKGFVRKRRGKGVRRKVAKANKIP